jgi:RimJ/RimL family protein N-acetyltransferase
MLVRLRQATDADDDFCFLLNLATMREYIEPVYGWDLDVQRMYHARWFNADRLSIIEDDNGTAIGVLDVSDESDHMYVSRIEVLPEVQGRGVGSAVMESLMMHGRTIRLQVFTNNVRAQRFYERLGFILDLDSEDEHHASMHRPGEDARPKSMK